MRSQQVGNRGLSGSHAPGEANHEHSGTVASSPAGRRAVDVTRATTDNLTNLATVVRWGTSIVGLLWAAALRSDVVALLLGVGLLFYSLIRTRWPVQYRRRAWRSLLSILVELAVTTAVTVATGCWDSPYIFVVFTPIIAAGFARGFWHAMRIGATASIAIGASAIVLNQEAGIRPATAWTGEFLIVATVASYGSRLLRRAEEVDALNLTQLWRLNEANTLLMSLNRLAHDIPVSFDFQETTASAISRVREATKPDLIALLLLEPLSSVWSVAMAEGARLPESYVFEYLPEEIRSASHGAEPRLALDLGGPRQGLKVGSRSGIYTPLWAGGRQVGMLAVEADSDGQFDANHVAVLKELSESIALTIDNARWFDRLRARGAAQERTRIARDLHDRVGQGVAYVAFELDRIAKQAEGTALGEEIGHLRDDARSMVSELRETLYDLRADVSDDRDFEATVKEFLARVAKRSKLEANFVQTGDRRLPLAQEREVWRICQEAVTNVERHADANRVSVNWDVDALGGAILTVTDDGVGLHSPSSAADKNGNYADSASPGRPSYGVTGMRERAEGIGGVLDILPGENGGTVVRLALGKKRETVR